MSFPLAPKSIHRIATIAFWVLAAVVAWGELGPGDIGFNVWDKLQHFGAYALLAGLAAVSMQARGRWLWALAGLIAFGGALEILQGMVGRDMSFRRRDRQHAGRDRGWRCGLGAVRAAARLGC